MQLREWNDQTSWPDVVKLAANPAARIAIIVESTSNLLAVLGFIMQRYRDGSFSYYSATRRLIFKTGATVRLLTVRNVCDYHLRGVRLTAAFAVGSSRWACSDRDCVQREIAPLIHLL